MCQLGLWKIVMWIFLYILYSELLIKILAVRFIDIKITLS